jgi:hypothetical protein
MDRRQFLRGTALLGGLAVSGCLADSPGRGTDTPTDTESDDTDDRTEAAVVDTSITTTGTECRSDEREVASVSMDEESTTVTVTGTMHTSDPCHEAVLDGTHYDAATGTLDVAVVAEPTDDVCVHCVGAVKYEVTVEFEGGLPATVTVRHGGEQIRPTPAGDLLVSSTDFTVTNKELGDTDGEASVTFEPDTVVVTGTIPGSDSCATATLESASYNPDRDLLSVAVVTVQEETEGTPACEPAFHDIDYRAEIGVDGDLPGTVVVTHDGGEVAWEDLEGGTGTETTDA